MFITFKGKRVGPWEISHNHLSNWWWYVNHTRREQHTDADRQYIQGLLDLRFEGKVLDYYPHPEYEFEIEGLKQKGMIDENNRIVIDSKVVGRLRPNVIPV